MILVVGGFAAGKRAYAQRLGFAPHEFSCDAHADCPVVVDVQELVRDLADSKGVKEIAQLIANTKQVVLYTEVGSGIVPVDAAERTWRDRAGELSCELAVHADVVVRVVCGIPVALKGRLPQALPGRSVEVVLMRHGATLSNERREYSGTRDVALSERGEAEARAAGICRGVDRVFVSPLQRARRTAEICFPNADQVVVDGIREMNFGDFEGRNADDLACDPEYRAWVDGGCDGRCPNGETRFELIERVCEALDGVLREAIEREDDRVVVVGHGGMIMAAMNGLTAEHRPYFDSIVGNCEGYVARAVIVDGRAQIVEARRFDDLAFLADGDEAIAHGRADGSGNRAGSSFFQNRACPYFPCHEGVPVDDFNCLFCYCPLYTLGVECPGDCAYTEKGRKDCTGCSLPHDGDGFASIVAQRYEELADLARERMRS